MNINAIPNNMEKCMALMLGNHLTFIDSFQFLSSSLYKLVNNLPKEAFKYTSERFKNEKFDLDSKRCLSLRLHGLAKSNDKNRRFGVIMTPLSRRNKNKVCGKV